MVFSRCFCNTRVFIFVSILFSRINLFFFIRMVSIRSVILLVIFIFVVLMRLLLIVKFFGIFVGRNSYYVTIVVIVSNSIIYYVRWRLFLFIIDSL